jgi:hypothetical protein
MSTSYVCVSFEQVSLLVCDIIMALGTIMDAHWALTGFVAPGSACTVQGNLNTVPSQSYPDLFREKGVIKHLGNVGVAWYVNNTCFRLIITPFKLTIWSKGSQH